MEEGDRNKIQGKRNLKKIRFHYIITYKVNGQLITWEKVIEITTKEIILNNGLNLEN